VTRFVVAEASDDRITRALHAAWSGLSAVGGALVGGATTGYVTYKSEKARQVFEREQRNADRDREDELSGVIFRRLVVDCFLVTPS